MVWPGHPLPRHVRWRVRFGSKLVTDLRMVEEPIRQSVLQSGGTIVSDGWDSIGRDHLINLLSGNTSGIFFDGTFCLASDNHEDAKAVAELLINFSIRIGWLSVVQVCTDTCAVMQAAWRIVIVRMPWETATCCFRVHSLLFRAPPHRRNTRQEVILTCRVLRRLATQASHSLPAVPILSFHTP